MAEADDDKPDGLQDFRKRLALLSKDLKTESRSSERRREALGAIRENFAATHALEPLVNPFLSEQRIRSILDMAAKMTLLQLEGLKVLRALDAQRNLHYVPTAAEMEANRDFYEDLEREGAFRDEIKLTGMVSRIVDNPPVDDFPVFERAAEAGRVTEEDDAEVKDRELEGAIVTAEFEVRQAEEQYTSIENSIKQTDAVISSNITQGITAKNTPLYEERERHVSELSAAEKRKLKGAELLASLKEEQRLKKNATEKTRRELEKMTREVRKALVEARTLKDVEAARDRWEQNVEPSLNAQRLKLIDRHISQLELLTEQAVERIQDPATKARTSYIALSGQNQVARDAARGVRPFARLQAKAPPTKPQGESSQQAESSQQGERDDDDDDDPAAIQQVYQDPSLTTDIPKTTEKGRPKRRTKRTTAAKPRKASSAKPRSLASRIASLRNEFL